MVVLASLLVMTGEELPDIDCYCDTVPRAFADVERIGSFTVFVGRSGHSFYARPAESFRGTVAAGEFGLVRSRQRELGVPEAFEWVHEMNPGLRSAAVAAGLPVRDLPLMVRRDAFPPLVPDGCTVRILPADDEALPAVLAAIGVGFGDPGTAVGVAGPVDRDAAIDRDGQRRDATRREIVDGLFVVAAAEVDSCGPVAGGGHSPRGAVTEITGVATLPAYRRRGIGAAVADALCRDAAGRGVGMVFLSAGSGDVARVYQRVGFARVGTACIAEPATPAGSA
jgi:GNAT superfamily N-acetyltransferase